MNQRLEVCEAGNCTKTHYQNRVSDESIESRGSQLASDLPQFREQHGLEGAAQVRHASRAAAASFEADDALDGGQVIEAPATEVILDIN